MEFHLTYQGPLLASAKKDHKHKIRQALHPQLRRLWAIHPLLKDKSHRTWFDGDDGRKFLAPHGKLKDLLAKKFAIGEYNFVPLVCEWLDVGCKLDILFLRPQGLGELLITSGDIDNRLKTLFDAMKIPGSLNELPGSSTPASDEQPFYCLLEDDSMINEISVRTGLLLESVDNAYDNSSARLVITVTMKPWRATWDNSGF